MLENEALPWDFDHHMKRWRPVGFVGFTKGKLFLPGKGMESKSHLWPQVESWPSDYPKHHVILFSFWGLIWLCLLSVTWPEVWFIKKPCWGEGKAADHLFLSEGPSYAAACRTSGLCHCWACSLSLVPIQKSIIFLLPPSLILSDTGLMLSLGISH